MSKFDLPSGKYVCTEYVCPGNKTIVWAIVEEVHKIREISSWDQYKYAPAPISFRDIPDGTEIARQVHYSLRGGLKGDGLTLRLKWEPIQFKNLTNQQLADFKKQIRGENDPYGIQNLWDISKEIIC